MRFRALILSAAVLAGASAHGSGSGGVVVGNGGDGVKIRGKIFVTDLVEFGKHEEPFVGSQYREADFERIRKKFGSSPVPLWPLARKIHDLDGRGFKLGEFVLLALEAHDWRWIKSPLARIEPSGDEVLLAAAQKREFVQIANRLRLVVRLDRELWLQMPPDQQVALLVHEAIYSLFVPECGAGACRIETAEVRELVGRLFLPPADASTPHVRLGMLMKKLAVPAQGAEFLSRSVDYEDQFGKQSRLEIKTRAVH